MAKLPTAKGESPGVLQALGQLKDEGKIQEHRRESSTNYGVMEQSWCCTCRAIQPMAVSSTQTLKDRAERDTMHNGRWHKEEPKGGYWCKVCGKRPYTAPRQPGRQCWPWEKE